MQLSHRLCKTWLRLSVLSAALSSCPSTAWTLSGQYPSLRPSSEFHGSRICFHDQRTLSLSPDGRSNQAAMGLSMVTGDAKLTVAVKHVKDSAMSGHCEKQHCSGQLGTVSCTWNGETRRSGEEEEPLAKTRHLCGVVEHAHESSQFKVGDVVIAPAEHGLSSGSKVDIVESLVVHKPASLSDEQACLFPVLSLLLLQAMKQAKVHDVHDLAGERVLVTGGTSPVGSLAIQVLAGVGAHVAATASGNRQQDELRALGAESVIDYKQKAFYEEVQDLALVLDALGSGRGSEGTALRKEGVRYAPLMHPAVALVLEEGMLFGGLKLKSFVGRADAVCEWTATEEGMAGVGELGALLEAKAIAPHFGGEAFTPAEWMEAIGWPKDVDTGGRFGFPGKSLWNDDDSSEQSEERIDFSVYDEESEGEEARRAAVLSVESMSQLEERLRAQGRGGLTLVEFHSPYCRACRGMRPRFNKLPQKYPENQFLSIDVKSQKELAGELGVDDVPAYVLYNGEQKKAKWTGVFRLDELEFFCEGGGLE